MTLLRPCATCGTPSPATRCPEHDSATVRRGSSPRQRGYDAAWDRLSRRARRLQPFCTDCSTAENLTTDHLPEAWERKALRLPLRLADVAVVCGPCNSRRGSSRPAQTHRDGGARPTAGTAGKAKGRLHTEVMPSRQALYGAVGPPDAA